MDTARLREQRKLKKLSQKEMGERLSLSRSAYSHYENGYVPDADTLKKVADILGCTMDYLMGRVDFPAPRLTPEEDEILALLRNASELTRRQVAAMLRVGEK